jgi:hypothetical protein
MAEGLVIPISTPGGEESAAILDRIADKLEEVGGAADKSATKMGASATSSSAAIGRIASATEGTKTAVERLGESGNRGLHALSEKASELAGSMGGAAGKIADVGIKSLAAFGGIGLQATAAVGAVLMLYNAYQQYEEKQRAVTAGATTLAAVNAQLGGSYDSVRLAAAQDGTAEERVNAIRAAGLWDTGPFECHVAKAEVNFRKPIRADEELDLMARTLRFGTTSMTTRVEIHGADVEDIRASIELVAVHIDLSDHRPRPLPATVRTALTSFDARTV